MLKSTFHALMAYALIGTSLPVMANPTDQYRIVEAAAARAKEQCYHHMYRDTNAYSQCIRDMRASLDAKPLQKLGVEYFGFVGALSYARVGHMNAPQIAAEFLQDFRKTQKHVGISDTDLCRTVAGDCQVRMAQTREMESAPPPKAASLRMRCIGQVCKLVPVE